MIIAVFKQRNETMLFSQMLKNLGVYTTVINTPKQTMVSCGISVQFLGKFLAQAKRLLQSGRFTSFVGFYTHEKSNGEIKVKKIS